MTSAAGHRRWQVFSSSRETRLRGRIRDREIEAVAGAHAHGAEAAALRVRIGEIARRVRSVSPPNSWSKKPPGCARGLPVLRAAIVLRQRDHDGAALLAAIEPPPRSRCRSMFMRSRLPRMRWICAVEIDALLRLRLQTAEQEEAARPRSPARRACCDHAVELALLAARRPPRSGGSARRAPDRAPPRSTAASCASRRWQTWLW